MTASTSDIYYGIWRWPLSDFKTTYSGDINILPIIQQCIPTATKLLHQSNTVTPLIRIYLKKKCRCGQWPSYRNIQCNSVKKSENLKIISFIKSKGFSTSFINIYVYILSSFFFLYLLNTVNVHLLFFLWSQFLKKCSQHVYTLTYKH